MARWIDFERDAPGLAAAARGFLDAHVHKVLATLRRDGSPRVSGIECRFHDGDLWFGSMWEARKALDLRRDPRFALHSGSEDPPAWSGDAKVSGRAMEVEDDLVKRDYHGGEPGPAGRWHLFRCDLDEVAVVRLDDAREKLVIERWAPGQEVRRHER